MITTAAKRNPLLVCTTTLSPPLPVHLRWLVIPVCALKVHFCLVNSVSLFMHTQPAGKSIPAAEKGENLQRVKKVLQTLKGFVTTCKPYDALCAAVKKKSHK